MYRLLPSYRSPTDIRINELFLLQSRDRETILRDLQIGFFAEWADKMPATGKTPKNYFKNPEGVKKCRDRFHSEIKKGRMIGGRGWTKKTVK